MDRSKRMSLMGGLAKLVRQMAGHFSSGQLTLLEMKDLVSAWFDRQIERFED